MTHEWMIPEAVLAIDGQIEIGKPIGDKLLTLEIVWKHLELRAKELDSKGQLAERIAPMPWRLETWKIDTHGISLPDQALAAFYASVVIELGNRQATSDYEQCGRAHTPLGKLCRESMTAPGRPRLDKNLVRSLETVADFFLHEAEFIERVNAASAYCLPRSSGLRNNDAIRTKVRALAEINQSIFGECMHETLVTMADSLLNCKVPKETVRSRCRGVRISGAA